MTGAFRCSAGSLERAEPLAGTASHVRSFLLIEAAGPWGRDAVRDSRMPPALQELADRATAAGVRVLLVRRPGRASPGARTHLFAARAAGEDSWLEGTGLPPDGRPDVDLDGLRRGRSAGMPRTRRSLFLVCTHGRHDACCAELGRPAAAALAGSFPDDTFEVSHIGGDRFAGNLLVLPEGLYYGRVSAVQAVAIAEAHRRGELVLDHLRGRSSEPFAVQVAEVELRRRLGLTGRGDVRPVHRSRTGDRTTATFATALGGYRVTVESGQLEPTRLTCRAAWPSAATSHRLVSVDRVGGRPGGTS